MVYISDKIRRQMKERAEWARPVTLVAQYFGNEAPGKPDWHGRREFLQGIFNDVSKTLGAKLGEFGLDADDMKMTLSVPKIDAGIVTERLERHDMRVVKSYGLKTYTGIWHG